MIATPDQYQGCLLGLALGDALGAPYEGGLLARAMWSVLDKTPDNLPRWTDDTQMSIDLATSLLHCNRLDQDDLAQRFAQSYRWSRGYGPSAAKVLKRIRAGEHWSVASKKVHKAGSFGNGAAMRASVLALFFPEDRTALIDATQRSAHITHAHPLGVQGALLIALAARQLLQRASVAQLLAEVNSVCTAAEFATRLALLANWLAQQATPKPREVVKHLGNGITAHTSSVTALYIALRHRDASFQEMLKFVIACGGDVDTIAAMAGTLWGAYNGAAKLPETAIEQRAEIKQLALDLHQRALHGATR